MQLRAPTLLMFTAIALAQPVWAWQQAPSTRPANATIIGRYEYRDRELAAHLNLRADHSFEYGVDGLEAPVEGEEQLNMLVKGIWRFADFGTIALTNAPTAPPSFRQTSAVRDPKVRAAFTIVATDGKPVENLGVLTDGGGSGQLNMISDEGWTIPLLHGWNTDDGKKGSPTKLPQSWEIVRSSDNLSLAKVALSPNGPNRFIFSYTRSAVEPFTLAARPAKDEPGMMEVELGTASITMHKVAR